MEYAERHVGTVLVLEMKDARLEASNAPDLREVLLSRIEKGHQQIVIDMQHVTFMDSSALGALIGGIKKLGPVGTIALAGSKGAVLQLMKLTRMDKVFLLFPSVAAALASMEG